MKVSEYRRLYDALSNAFASLQSARRGPERITEAARVRRRAVELMHAECPRAKQEDRDMAERLIDRTAKYLGEAGL